MTNTRELTTADLLHPEWNAPPTVRALMTTRNGGVSEPPFGRWTPEGDSGAGRELPGGLNLGRASGDDLEHVDENRSRLLAYAGTSAAWLKQVHGAEIVDAAHALEAARAGEPLAADASVTDRPGIACTVMVADCMPVLFCDPAGRAVGAAHAGWRGLAAGIVEKTAQRVAALAACEVHDLHVWLGPAIGPAAFEVGEDVRDAFMSHAAGIEKAEQARVAEAFVARPEAPGKYLADLYALARVRLAVLGITRLGGGDFCAFTQRERFYSYRRDRVTGRMAALVWLAG
jgi:YfiH family protein